MAAARNEPRPGTWRTRERSQRARELLAQALEVTPSQRPAFLDRICAGDSSLRSDLEALLADDNQADSGFLPNTATTTDLGVSQPATSSLIGRRIGPYQIVQQIGVGGMGVVYRAFRADDQYRKEVAIKLVRSGQDSQFVARFKNERQLLASLDHPNIARLLDGGTTDEGEPYFVMELIEGRPITEYCDRHKLSLTDRLQLFLQVCSAVQYAHQRLIIHRDIKPGNSLVTEEGIPKLLDFGIAKMLNPDAEAGGSEATVTLFRALTPAYASPEQVREEVITTASDVYSLGVVLYELLVGRHPYWRAENTMQEIAHAVCDVEPQKPSTQVRRSKERSIRQESGTSADRFDAAGADKLSKALRGDLDNIVLMALRKEPQRR